MNDFTKDELQFIWQKLAIADYENTEMHHLPNKVCGMIYNYTECSHDWSDPLICFDNIPVRNCNVCGAWK